MIDLLQYHPSSLSYPFLLPKLTKSKPHILSRTRTTTLCSIFLSQMERGETPYIGTIEREGLKERPIGPPPTQNHYMEGIATESIWTDSGSFRSQRSNNHEEDRQIPLWTRADRALTKKGTEKIIEDWRIEVLIATSVQLQRRRRIASPQSCILLWFHFILFISFSFFA